MVLENVCSPAIIYVAFSFIHILVDTIKSSYDEALSKFCIMIVFTTILNILCERGLGVISWFIVFIPFITMTLLSQVLLMVIKKNRHGDKDKIMSDIDKINLLRSGSGEEPEPAIEFSECKAKKCDPGNSSSSYTIDPNEHVHAVTDSLSFAYKNAMNTESGAAGAAGPAGAAGADADAGPAGAEVSAFKSRFCEEIASDCKKCVNGDIDGTDRVIEGTAGNLGLKLATVVDAQGAVSEEAVSARFCEAILGNCNDCAKMEF